MRKTNEKFWLWAGLAAGAVVLGLLLLGSVCRNRDRTQLPYQPTRAPTQVPTQSVPPDSGFTAATLETEALPGLESDELAQQGLQIRSVGSYTGAFVEDGTNDIVSGVAMLVLENRSGEPIQYAEILLHGPDQTLSFVLSTLPDGEAMVVLEQNRQEYREGTDYTAELKSLALFDTPPSLHQDALAFQVLDGAVNISNISGADLTGDVVIYYKNFSQDLLYGGITYRVRIQGGMAAGEIRQIMAKHFTADSRILFVTIG